MDKRASVQRFSMTRCSTLTVFQQFHRLVAKNTWRGFAQCHEMSGIGETGPRLINLLRLKSWRKVRYARTNAALVSGKALTHNVGKSTVLQSGMIRGG